MRARDFRPAGLGVERVSIGIGLAGSAVGLTAFVVAWWTRGVAEWGLAAASLWAATATVGYAAGRPAPDVHSRNNDRRPTT